MSGTPKRVNVHDTSSFLAGEGEMPLPLPYMVRNECRGQVAGFRGVVGGGCFAAVECDSGRVDGCGSGWMRTAEVPDCLTVACKKRLGSRL